MSAISIYIPSVRAAIGDDPAESYLQVNTDAQIAGWIRLVVNRGKAPGLAIDGSGAGDNVTPDAPLDSQAAAALILAAALVPFGVPQGNVRTRAISYSVPAGERARAQRLLEDQYNELMAAWDDGEGHGSNSFGGQHQIITAANTVLHLGSPGAEETAEGILGERAESL